MALTLNNLYILLEIMPENKLRHELEKLRAEVNNAETDSETRQRLQALITDIEGKLAHPDDSDHHDTLVSHIKDTITHFETEHPRATGILNEIMIALGNMGI